MKTNLCSAFCLTVNSAGVLSAPAVSNATAHFSVENRKALMKSTKLAAILMALLSWHWTVSAATLYVSPESTNPMPPYATWETAARVIQDAVDAAKTGDTVLVTNGVYSVGERDGNRVAITNSIRLESVNGPLVTTVEGSQLLSEYGYLTNGTRCVLLGTNAVLSGFTLTNGFGSAGGGALSEPSAVVSNCILTGNWATSNGGGGGGAYGGTLYNCTLTGNASQCGPSGPFARSGGGAANCTLYNCTLTENSAHSM